ncbi:MAG: HAD family phosphatase [Prevotella sp.]|nr:HAD family phosphatase [Prevotella sp.]
MTGIKNIIFDLGGVLVGFDSRRSIDAFSRLGCEKVAEYVREHRTEDLFYRIELGQSNTQDFCAEVRQMTATKASDEAIIAAWNALLTPVTPERKQRLIELRQSGIRLFLLSNTNDMHWQLCSSQLEGCFERVFLSYEMQLAKPNPEIFSEVLRRADIDARETLFIDDNADNIAAAQSLGIQTFHNQAIDDWLLQLPNSCNS